MAEDKEIVDGLRPLLDEGFKLTQIEDRGAYLHLRLETDRARKADIIKPFENRDDITIISDLITSEKSLKLINDIVQHLRSP